MTTLAADLVLERLKVLAREELEMKPDDLARIGPETPLVEGLALDSLKQVVLVTGVEERFGLDLADLDRDQLRTIGDLVRLIQERLPPERSWS